MTVYGFNSLFNRPDYFSHSLYAWGADWFDTAVTRATVDTPAYATATQAMVDLVAKHRVTGGGDFTRGTMAMYLTSTWYIRAIDESPVRRAGAKIEMTMLPKGPAGRPVPLQNNANYLGTGSKAADATWLLYKHLLSTDVPATASSEPSAAPRNAATTAWRCSPATSASTTCGRTWTTSAASGGT